MSQSLKIKYGELKLMNSKYMNNNVGAGAIPNSLKSASVLTCQSHSNAKLQKANLGAKVGSSILIQQASSPKRAAADNSLVNIYKKGDKEFEEKKKLLLKA
jgi:hypothetical protein